MELYFSSGAVKDAAEYVARKYPRGKVGVCDKEGTMTSALNAVGNPTVKADEAKIITPANGELIVYPGTPGTGDTITIEAL